MHSSSLENMQKCFERYVWGGWSRGRELIRVLDIGGADVYGSYADIFSETRFEYVAADVEPGPGGDLVLEDPYRLRYDDGTVDIAISGQVFEHVEFFWETFREMCRVVTPEGLIFLIAPSAGPIHRYPVDCWRFYPDAYTALARYGGVELIDCRLDDRGPWNDLVGVFSRTSYARPETNDLRRAALESGMNLYRRERAPVPMVVQPAAKKYEAVQGEQSYLEVMKAIHSALEPRFYLELGVRTGASLALASCPAVAVDPDADVAAAAAPNAVIVQEPSDFFFEFSARQAIEGRPIDLAFIDGMHRFEFALRDFMNIEAISTESSVIVIDDIYPNHPVQAANKRESRVWTGDVWKLYHCLRIYRPDLHLFPLKASPAGLLVIANLDPRNRVLWEQYNPVVRSYRDMDLMDNEMLILARQGSLSTTDERAFSALQGIREARTLLSAAAPR